LLRQKKVTKEKATRLPLASCAPRFCRGSAEGAPAPLPTRGIPAAPLRAVLDKSSGARRGIREKIIPEFEGKPNRSNFKGTHCVPFSNRPPKKRYVVITRLLSESQQAYSFISFVISNRHFGRLEPSK